MSAENRPKRVTLKTIKPIRWDGEHRDPGFILENLSPGDANYFQAEKIALPAAEADKVLAEQREAAAKKK